MCKEPLYLSEKRIRFLAGEDHILNQPYGHIYARSHATRKRLDEMQCAVLLIKPTSQLKYRPVYVSPPRRSAILFSLFSFQYFELKIQLVTSENKKCRSGELILTTSTLT